MPLKSLVHSKDIHQICVQNKIHVADLTTTPEEQVDNEMPGIFNKFMENEYDEKNKHEFLFYTNINFSFHSVLWISWSICIILFRIISAIHKLSAKSLNVLFTFSTYLLKVIFLLVSRVTDVHMWLGLHIDAEATLNWATNFESSTVALCINDGRADIEGVEDNTKWPIGK